MRLAALALLLLASGAAAQTAPDTTTRVIPHAEASRDACSPEAASVPLADGRIAITQACAGVAIAALTEAPALRDSLVSLGIDADALLAQLGAVQAARAEEVLLTEAETAMLRSAIGTLTLAVDVRTQEADGWEARYRSQARQTRIWRSVALPGLVGIGVAFGLGAVLF